MRRRLILAIVGVAGCAVLLFALPLALVLQRSYRNEELLRLQRDTDAATRGVDLSAGLSDQIELPAFSGQIGIYSTGGKLIRGSGPLRGDGTIGTALRTGAPSTATPSGRLEVVVPLRNGERLAGVMRTARFQGAITARAHRAWLALAGLVVAVVTLALLAALALGRRLARPLEGLAATARTIGEGDFAARAEPTNMREIDDVGAALNASSQRIGELVDRERSFSANASHQLRTPLAALRLELETLALEAPERAPDLETALTQVDRLTATITTLLQLARGNLRGERRSDLKEVLRDFEARWRGPLAAEGRPFRVDLALEESQAAIPPAVLREILEVLVNNAQRHGEGTIRLAARRAGDVFVLSVSDQGPGFGGAEEGQSAKDGHGLGLPLARSLAHAEGAQLQVTVPGPNPVVSLLIRTVPPGGAGCEESARSSRSEPPR